MKRLSTPLAIFSVSMELRAGRNVDTTADRKKHHCTDTRNVISDLRNFYAVDVESVYTGYVNPISGRRTRYIETYRLGKSINNLTKMDDVLRGLAVEIEELKTVYALKQEKSKKAA